MSLKIIHRIYFGFDGKPDLTLHYLETWKKELPDYEIKYWNSNNLPINNCFFSKLMFSLKDHAFLSDYFRWYLLREYGGVYFDADIEVVNGKLFNDLVEAIEINDDLQGMIGIDKKTDGWYTAHSMVFKKGSKITRFMCEVYESMGPIAFWRRKIFYFMAPQLTALYFAKNGYNEKGMGCSPNKKEPFVVDGVKIYPQDYFSPLSPSSPPGSFVIDGFTDNTCICHHFACSWQDDDSPYKKNTNSPLLKDLIKQLGVGEKPIKKHRIKELYQLLKRGTHKVFHILFR